MTSTEVCLFDVQTDKGTFLGPPLGLKPSHLFGFLSFYHVASHRLFFLFFTHSKIHYNSLLVGTFETERERFTVQS